MLVVNGFEVTVLIQNERNYFCLLLFAVGSIAPVVNIPYIPIWRHDEWHVGWKMGVCLI